MYKIHSKVLIAIIWVLFASMVYTFALINPSKVLQPLYNKITAENPIEKVGGKASVSNLFQKALEDAKNKKFIQNFENLQALTQLVQSQ